MRSAVAPLDPARVVKALLSGVDAGPPEKFDQAVVVVDETDELIVDRDRPTAGERKAVDHYRGTHPSRVAQGDVRRRRPSCGRSSGSGRNMSVGGGPDASRRRPGPPPAGSATSPYRRMAHVGFEAEECGLVEWIRRSVRGIHTPAAAGRRLRPPPLGRGGRTQAGFELAPEHSAPCSWPRPRPEQGAVSCVRGSSTHLADRAFGRRCPGCLASAATRAQLPRPVGLRPGGKPPPLLGEGAD